MSVNLESRKLRIVDYLVNLDDEAIILQIENLLFPHGDWWDTLSGKDVEAIQAGIAQAEGEQTIDIRVFMSDLRKKYEAH